MVCSKNYLENLNVTFYKKAGFVWWFIFESIIIFRGGQPINIPFLKIIKKD